MCEIYEPRQSIGRIQIYVVWVIRKRAYIAYVSSDTNIGKTRRRAGYQCSYTRNVTRSLKLNPDVDLKADDLAGRCICIRSQSDSESREHEYDLQCTE